MKKIFIIPIVFILLFSLATAIPVKDISLNSFVNDYTDSLTSEQVQSLTIIGQSLQQSGIEYAIVVVDSTEGLAIADYALEIGHENIGGEEDKGLVTVIALNDRKYYTAVGYGLEGFLNDAKIGRFQRDYLVPAFQEGAYGVGLINLAAVIHKELLPEKKIPGNLVIPVVKKRGYGNYSMFTFIAILFVIRTIATLALRKRKGTRNANDAFSAALLASMFMRGGGGGLGGGGFGGFSGGGFGGGGAGGSF